MVKKALCQHTLWNDHTRDNRVWRPDYFQIWWMSPAVVQASMGYVRTWDHSKSMFISLHHCSELYLLGIFLKSKSGQSHGLMTRGSTRGLFLSSSYAKTAPVFVRKDKLKSHACSSDKDNLSHHHHSSLSSQLTWFQEICFVDLLHTKQCLYQSTEQSIHLLILSFKNLYWAPPKCQYCTWFWGIKLWIRHNSSL